MSTISYVKSCSDHRRTQREHGSSWHGHHPHQITFVFSAVDPQVTLLYLCLTNSRHDRRAERSWGLEVDTNISLPPTKLIEHRDLLRAWEGRAVPLPQNPKFGR